MSYYPYYKRNNYLISKLIYTVLDMYWLDQNILYSIPDEIGSFGDCSLNNYGIQCLKKHYSQDKFKHIPNTLITWITTYTNELLDVLMIWKQTLEN